MLSLGIAGSMLCGLALSGCSPAESNASREAAAVARSQGSSPGPFPPSEETDPGLDTADVDPTPTSSEEEEVDVSEIQVGSDRWPMEVVCPGNRYSFTSEGNFTNLTTIPLMLLAGDIDCADWSGRATPATKLTSKTVQPGEAFNYTVEARNNYNRKWTMGVMTEDYAEFPNTFRMEIKVGSMGWPRLESDKFLLDCQSVTLGPDPSGTRSSRLPDPPGGDTYTNQHWFWSDGEFIYILKCHNPPKPTN